MKIKQEALDRLSIPIKLSFPVINVTTFESGRAELFFEELANFVGKSFVKMPFKQIPSRPVLDQMVKEAKSKDSKKSSQTPDGTTGDFKGLVIFDAFFFDRQKSDNEALPALRSSLNFLETEGINYVIADKETFNDEFVYHIDLPPLHIDEIKSILSTCEQSVNQDGVFDDQERTLIANNSLGLSYTQMKNIFTYCAFLKHKKLDYMGEIRKEKSHILRDVGLDVIQPVGIDSVGGLENIKDFLMERRAGWNKDLPVKGLLLAGVPGGGKTLIAKAAASVLETSLVRLDMTKFYSKFLGETERQFSRALQTIDQIAPVCVLIDETEKAFGQSEGEHEVSKRLLGIFLYWLQERKSKVFIVATANRVHALPTEFMRAGRWDKTFFIDLPNSAERKVIFKIHLSRYSSIEQFDLERLVIASEGYTGAEIEQAITDSLYMANARELEFDQSILLEAVQRITPTSETRREDINRIRDLKNQGFYPASASESHTTNSESKVRTLAV